MVPALITSLWVVLSLASYAVARRRGMRGPRLSVLGSRVVVAAEVSAIAVALLTGGAVGGRGSVVAGIILLLLGCAESYRRLLCPRRGQPNLVRDVVRWISQLLEPPPEVEQGALLGDCIQLAGLALVWSSLHSLAFSLVAVPTAVRLVSRARRRPGLRIKGGSVGEPPPVPVIWPGWRFLGRIAVIAVLPAVLYAVIARDVSLFRGDQEQASTLVGTLFQVEATVATLIVALLFALVELTASAYSPRLTKLLFSRPSSKTLAFAVLSPAIKVALMAGMFGFPGTAGTGSGSILVDWALLWTMLAAFAHVKFARDALALVSPETLVKDALKQFDPQWLQTVRDEWSSSLGPRSMHVEHDPLVLLDRILVSALERGDRYTFRTSLILMRDCIQSVCNQHDGAVIDAYLSDRLADAIDMAGVRRADDALGFLTGIASEVTAPSQESLRDAEITHFDVPLGTMLFRRVVEVAIGHRLPHSAAVALGHIGSRATQAVESLPPFSALWLFNKDTRDTGPPDSKRHSRSTDSRVLNYIWGFLGFLGDVGEKALTAGLAEVSQVACHELTVQVATVVDQIPEEPYQRYLVGWALYQLETLARRACGNRTRGGVQVGLLSFSLRVVEHADVARMISEYLCRLVVRMAEAGILDPMAVMDTAMATLDLAQNNPQVVLPVLEALGKAGESLRTWDDSPERDDLVYVRNEIRRRIDQIELAGLRPGISTKVRRAAASARRRTGSNAGATTGA